MSETIIIPFVGVQGPAGVGGGGGGAAAFTELTDTPSSYTANVFLVTNPGGTAIELADAAAAITLLGLAPVAASGDYNDLLNLPTLFSGAWVDLTGVPATFAPSAHSHALSDITDAGTAAGSDTGDFEPAGAIAAHAGQASGVHGISAFGATLIDDTDAPTARATLGLGSAATSDSSDFALASHALQLHGDVANPLNPSNGQGFMFSVDEWVARDLVAGDIKSGTFSEARIPSLDASKINGKQGPGAAFDGGGTTITSGVVVRSPVTQTGTLTACYADTDQIGSIDIIVRHYAAADTAFASPTALGTLSIASALKGSLTGLNQAVAAGDTLEFETAGTIINTERLAVRSRI